MNYRVFYGIAVALAMVIGCAKKPRQIDYSKAVCPASDFYVTDAERASLTAKAPTNAAAAYRLYEYYGGFRFDLVSSGHWLKIAAEQGDAKAQDTLAISPFWSLGYINLEESKAWMKKAANQGYQPAKEMLSNSVANVKP
jgi:hypothetical protein